MILFSLAFKRMRKPLPALIRPLIFILALGAMVCATEGRALANPALLQQSKETKEPTGSISGRVTISGKPATDVAVMLADYIPGPRRKSIAKTTTDDEGRFQLTRLPAGRFKIQVFAPLMVAEDYHPATLQDKAITLADGEAVSGVNIALKRGGVITGRVTDATGRPLIMEQVTLMAVNERGDKQYFYPTDYSLTQTDDRGVYRVYGVPPGLYLVSAGAEDGQDKVRIGFGNSLYLRTFHPGVTDESKATIVEVTAGGESTGVDITFGRAEKAYRASGHIIDADTGAPVPGLIYGYGSVDSTGKLIGAFEGVSNRSNMNGEFLIEGISPGRYAAIVIPEQNTQRYGEAAIFEITNSDVNGIDIKTSRAASISGVAVIEGTSNRETRAMLSSLNLNVYLESEQGEMPKPYLVKVNHNGTFHISGLGPGKAFVRLGYPSPKETTITRIERDGIEQRDGIAVAASEQITGVKLVIAYGTGVIRGQIKVKGDLVIEDLRFFILVRRAGTFNPNRIPATEVDSRGGFVIEGLSTGDYELNLLTVSAPGRKVSTFPTIRETVTVTNGVESEVTFQINQDTKN